MLEEPTRWRVITALHSPRCGQTTPQGARLARELSLSQRREGERPAYEVRLFRRPERVNPAEFSDDRNRESDAHERAVTLWSATRRTAGAPRSYARVPRQRGASRCGTDRATAFERCAPRTGAASRAARAAVSSSPVVSDGPRAPAAYAPKASSAYAPKAPSAHAPKARFGFARSLGAAIGLCDVTTNPRRLQWRRVAVAITPTASAPLIRRISRGSERCSSPN